MEIPYTVNARRDTGLFNSKIGIWLFLASEVMLFGGLFSGYVFLRVGVRDGIDVPWPNGIDIQNYKLGFVNTLVLILSSVLIVMAWAQLKLRNWRGFQAYMWGVLICSAGFMCIKTIEYKKKFTHHGVRMLDGTLVDGMFVNNKNGEAGDEIIFNASAVEFGLSKIDPYFLKFADPEANMVFMLDGEEVPREDLVSTLKEYRKANEEAGTVSMELAEPVDFIVKAQHIPRRNYFETSIPFFGGNSISGELVRDNVIIEVHDMDFQMVRGGGQFSEAWDLAVHKDQEEFGDTLGYKYKEAYANFVDYQKKKYEPWVAKGQAMPAYKIGLWKKLKDPTHGGYGDDKAHAEPEHEVEKGEASDHTAEKGHGDHHYPVIEIPRDQISFMSAHGPRFSTYHAIYFTITGLHGLHVIGGAIVLGYFLFFGKKLYLKNPEHMANRVEVGGLFWHFVDLVWIFLFPIMYLM